MADKITLVNRPEHYSPVLVVDAMVPTLVAWPYAVGVSICGVTGVRFPPPDKFGLGVCGDSVYSPLQERSNSVAKTRCCISQIKVNF